MTNPTKTPLSVAAAATVSLLGGLVVTVPSPVGAEGVAELDHVVYYETEFDDGNTPGSGTVGPADGMQGLDDVVISPDGNHVYASGSLDDAIAIFSRDTTTGLLTYEDTVEQGVSGVDGIDFVQKLAISPDGDHLYAAGRAVGIVGAVAVFARNATTGALTQVDVEKDGVGGVAGLGGAEGVTVSPDGKHVYATGRAGDGVVVFSRNAGTGHLTWVENQLNTVVCPDCLDSPHAVQVSPDDKHVYVVSGSQIEGTPFTGSDTIVAFSRNTTTGALTFEQSLADGVGGVDGLLEVNDLTISPDGEHIYTAAQTGTLVNEDDWLGVFSRDSTTGLLTFVEEHAAIVDTDPCGFSFSVGAETDIVISPDGTHAYAVDQRESALVEFHRDATTGALSSPKATCRGANFTGAFFDELVSGLSGARSVIMSPNGEHVYVGSFSPAAVNVFGPPSYIEITKDLDPDGSPDFTFTLDGTEMLPTPVGPLDDDADGTNPNTTMIAVEPGDYTVEEIDIPGFGLTGLDCTDPTADTTTDVPSRTATIPLAIEETVSCTFTNEPGPIVPVPVDRIEDTRGGPIVGSADGSAGPHVVNVFGKAGLPNGGIDAVALNVTVDQTQDPNLGGGFVTVYSCGPRPNASNLNFRTGQTVPNSVIAPVAPNGDLCFYVYGLAHLIVDVSGYFPTGSGFTSVAVDRIEDTRGGPIVGSADGSAGPHVVNVFGKGGLPGAGIDAVALNVTVDQTQDPDLGGGFVTVYSCGPRPNASNLNFRTGQTVPNSVIAPVAPNGDLCFYVYGLAHLIVDVSGYFPAT